MMTRRRLFDPRAGIAVLCVACGFASASAGPNAEPARTVLTVHWGAENFPATPLVDQAIRQALFARRDIPIDYFSEYLESDLFSPVDAEIALRDSIARKFRGRRIDVVIAIGDPALRFVLDHRAGLFPGAPLVYSGLWTPQENERVDGAGITGVTRGSAYGETVRLALRLHPDTNRVFIVAKGSDPRNLDLVRAQLGAESRNVQLEYIAQPTVRELLATVRDLPPRSVIVYIWHSQEVAGHLIYPDEVARLVGEVAPVPVYGTNDLYVGAGIVGGVMRDTAEAGRRVGEMARRILAGTPAQAIPIEAARLRPVFDWRQTRRWRIDPSWLPTDAIVRFRTPTLWETHPREIVGTVVVLASQSLLIAGLLTQRARRRRAEEVIRTSEAAHRSAYQRIRQLTAHLITAQESARGSIARDLHDGICQELVGVTMAVNSLKRVPGSVQDPETQRTLAAVERQALHVVESVRRLSHELHPASLQLVGLVAALRAHCVEVERRHDVQVDFQAQGDFTHVSGATALCLFRILQEALRNGAVHGGARRIAASMALNERGDQVELIVWDDGQGFDWDTVRGTGGGLGLVSMEERAYAIGGELHILTRPGRGTTIRVRVPASANPEKAVAAQDKKRTP